MFSAFQLEQKEYGIQLDELIPIGSYKAFSNVIGNIWGYLQKEL